MDEVTECETVVCVFKDENMLMLILIVSSGDGSVIGHLRDHISDFVFHFFTRVFHSSFVNIPSSVF